MQAGCGATRRGLLGLGLAAPGWRAMAQDGPISLIVPFTPGTGPDVLARLIAPVLQQALGRPVVVDNRAGASGNIGTQAAARAAPDGRTLLLQANTFVMNPSLFRQVPYDPIGSFAPIILLTRGDLVLAVNPDVRAATAAEFAALAGQQMQDYASPGVGTPQHMAMALFGQVARVALNHVPYRGSAPAIQDLLGRRVAAMMLPVHTALPLAADGRIRLLAVGSPGRSAVAPAVPTMAEAGFAGAEVDLWYGLLGPAGLPAAQVARLNSVLEGWLRLAPTAETLRAQGMAPVGDSPGGTSGGGTPGGGTPAAFAALLGRDLERWAGVIRAAGIAAD